ncbi:MAG: DUF1735 domain-containing protein [Bacteroidales bacterium]|nr:DUF1735 domain-containing protein [Bacteroidales bacterium]
MKKAMILMGVIALFAATACDDYRDDYLPEDSVYLRSADDNLIVEYSVYDATNRIGLIKAGQGSKACTVELAIDNSLVGDYNYDHGTDYVPLPKAMYNASEIDGKTVKIGEKDARAMIEVKWDPTEMVAEMSSTPDKYVIPVWIKSATCGIQEAKRLLLVRPIMATLAPRAAQNPVTCKEASTATVKLGLVLSAPIDTKDVTVHLSFTPRSFSTGGKDYAAAPAGSVVLRKESVVIPAGVSEIDFQVDLDMSNVTVDYVGGDINITGVEVRKTSNADKARADESADDVFTAMPVTAASMQVLVTRTKKAS